MRLRPYWLNGVWVFDDDRVGLKAEMFVGEINNFINDMLKSAEIDKKKAEKGFYLTFAKVEFPGAIRRFAFSRGATEIGCGNYYRVGAKKVGEYWVACKAGPEGWLCPALFHYFAEAPKNIYARAEPLDK